MDREADAMKDGAAGVEEVVHVDARTMVAVDAATGAGMAVEMVPSKRFDSAAEAVPPQRDAEAVDPAHGRIHAGDTVVWPDGFDDPSSLAVSAVWKGDGRRPDDRYNSMEVVHREVRKRLNDLEHPREMDQRSSADFLGSTSPRGDCPDSICSHSAPH